MKRIILAFLILIIIPFLLNEEQSVYQQAEEIRKANSKNPEMANWEYVKDRIFDGETSFFGRLEGPISIIFEEGTKEDSLLLEKTVSEIGEILPNKEFRILNSFGELDKNNDSWFYICFTSNPKNYTDPDKGIINLTSGHFIEVPPNIRRDNRLDVGRSMKVALPEKHYHINNNIIVDAEKLREKSLKAGLLRKLVLLQNDSDVEGRSVFRKKNITGLDSFFNDRDIFLLQKLYSDDFLEQFKEYLYEHYPWRYAFAFLNKDKIEFLAIGINFMFGITLFLLTFGIFQRENFEKSFSNYYVPILFIIWLAFDLSTIFNYLTDFSFAFVDKIQIGVYLVIGIGYALLISFFIWITDKFIRKVHLNFSFELILKVFFTFIAFYAPILPAFLLGARIDSHSFISTDLYFIIALAIGRGILIYLNHLSDSLVKQKDVELSQLQEAKAQSELKLLQSHINPHFLYNALNSIAGLAHDDADKTEKMALSLSDLFRYSLNKKGEKMSTVDEEVQLVENYLDIEKIRFGDRLSFTLSVGDDVKNEKIPMFLLQPLVENAVKHGISKIGGPAQINLCIKREKGNLIITVHDNGPDFPEGLISGHGLQTVHDLLRLSYGDSAGLSWVNTPKKQIVITIKKQEDEQNI